MEDEERRWTDENIDMVALKHFPNIDKEKAMSRPILYSNWLSKVRGGRVVSRPQKPVRAVGRRPRGLEHGLSVLCPNPSSASVPPKWTF